MKKLTALALAGILTLSACGSTAEQRQNLGELTVATVVGAGIVCGLAKIC